MQAVSSSLHICRSIGCRLRLPLLLHMCVNVNIEKRSGFHPRPSFLCFLFLLSLLLLLLLRLGTDFSLEHCACCWFLIGSGVSFLSLLSAVVVSLLLWWRCVCMVSDTVILCVFSAHCIYTFLHIVRYSNGYSLAHSAIDWLAFFALFARAVGRSAAASVESSRTPTAAVETESSLAATSSSSSSVRRPGRGGSERASASRIV